MKQPHSREASSVAWYNMEKTKAVKEYYRCSEFGGCRKNGAQEHRISSSDFGFEVEEQDKQLQSSGDERTSRGAKRTRWLYLLENANSTSLKHSLSVQPTSSKSTECDSLTSKLQIPDDDQVAGGVKRKRSKLKGGLMAHNHQQRFNVDHNRDVKMGEYLVVELEDLHQSAFHANGLEVTSSYSETALVDVHVTVKASYQAECVPFVSLTSKLNGKAILGYPLEIRKLSNGSEASLQESFAPKLLDEERNGFHRLIWRTSKRTPVCYVTNSLSSSNSKNGLASNGGEDSRTPTRENNLLINEQSFIKLLKNPKQERLGKTGLSRICVPVDLIFSKLLAAVDQIQS